MRRLHAALAVLLAGSMLSLPASALAQERTVKITGFGAKSGVVRVFGINSEAAMKAVRRSSGLAPTPSMASAPFAVIPSISVR